MLSCLLLNDDGFRMSHSSLGRDLTRMWNELGGKLNSLCRNGITESELIRTMNWTADSAGLPAGGCKGSWDCFSVSETYQCLWVYHLWVIFRNWMYTLSKRWVLEKFTLPAEEIAEIQKCIFGDGSSHTTLIKNSFAGLKRRLRG